MLGFAPKQLEQEGKIWYNREKKKVGEKEMDKEQFRSLPEKLRRLILGQEAIEIGKGGVSQVAKKYDVSRTTVTKGKKEYLAGEKYSSETGSRKNGGGRKLVTEKNPEITTLIIEMIEKENGVYGDPMTERRWTTLSTRKIAHFLKKDHGIDISSNTVRRILKKQIQPSAEQKDEGNR